MKRILFFILFAVSLTAFAQVQLPQEYTIQKPLRLETVNAGSTSDSVLVRGADKVIKYVPRSEFSGGSDVPNLQQVLAQGTTDTIGNTMEFSLPELPNQVSYWNFAGGGIRNSNNLTAIGPNSIMFYNQLDGEAGAYSVRSILKGSSSVGPAKSSIYRLPDEVEGEYILATDRPASNTQTGLVNNTALQELGGVDKMIHGARIGTALGTGNNTLFGVDALLGNTTGTNNTAIGNSVLQANITSSYNTGVGAFSLNAVTSEGNTAVGAYSLLSNVTAPNNTAIGVSSLQNLTGGVGFNTAIGSEALYSATTGNQNIGIGAGALHNLTTGNFNMGIGNLTLQNVVTGTGNTAVGAAAGNGVKGNYCTSIGYLANGFNNSSTGSLNTTIGYQAGRDLSTGGGNVLIESPPGGGSLTTGSNNIIINSGNRTSGITTGSGSTVIGATGLSAADTGLVVIANGTGTVAIRKEADNRLLAPTLTQALIISGGNTSLVNKAYADNMGAINNATTSALTSATLTSTYPNAIIGFRVQCMSISGGGKIYEKLTSGWAEYSATQAP